MAGWVLAARARAPSESTASPEAARRSWPPESPSPPNPRHRGLTPPSAVPPWCSCGSSTLRARADKSSAWSKSYREADLPSPTQHQLWELFRSCLVCLPSGCYLVLDGLGECIGYDPSTPDFAFGRRVALLEEFRTGDCGSNQHRSPGHEPVRSQHQRCYLWQARDQRIPIGQYRRRHRASGQEHRLGQVAQTQFRPQPAAMLRQHLPAVATGPRKASQTSPTPRAGATASMRGSPRGSRG